jgi:hypothetical protein
MKQTPTISIGLFCRLMRIRRQEITKHPDKIDWSNFWPIRKLVLKQNPDKIRWANLSSNTNIELLQDPTRLTGGIYRNPNTEAELLKQKPIRLTGLIYP